MGCRPLLIGAGPMFPLAVALPDLESALGIAAVLGVAVGLEATLLSNLLYRIEDLFHRLPVHWMWWPALGAIVVGLGGLIDAHVLGAGYGTIQALLANRSEEHTSELQSLMRISYAVFGLKKKKH